MRDGYCQALCSVCDFKPNECFVFVGEPQGLIGALMGNSVSEFRLFDVTAPRESIIHGKVPYAELETFQPTGVGLAELEKWSVLPQQKQKQK